MTQRDVDKLKSLHQAIQKQITQAEAGELLDLSREWVNRICQRIKKKGDRVIIWATWSFFQLSITSGAGREIN